MRKLLSILLLVLIMSCSKTEIQQPAAGNQAQGNGYSTYNKGKITVNIQSNFKYPYLSIGNQTVTLKRINHAPSTFTTLAPYSYSMQLTLTGLYTVYVHANKGSTGMTYMTDTNAIWHNVQVFYNDTIPLTVTGKDAYQTSFLFNIK